MAESVGKYTFLPWLRRGTGNWIEQADRFAGAPAGTNERATVGVGVILNGNSISKSFKLIGPGDVIGINPQMIVRTSPLAWVTEFEPNHLAAIEFYDEDFIWRFTPAKPVGEKLSPWLALLVLKDADGDRKGEFEQSEGRGRLSSIKLAQGNVLPPLSGNWMMGHVHINESNAAQSDFEAFIASLEGPDARWADTTICRLVSARRLEPNTLYRAFVVPAFETGRLAGLGQDPSGTDAQAPAWTGSGGVELPYYHDWKFRTGESESFESLVKRLQPEPVDARVGVRDMDGRKPGFGVTAGTDIGTIPPPGTPQDIIGLEGALRAPTSKSRPLDLDSTKPFVGQLEAVLNLADDRVVASQGAADPVVTPPIYGQFHALKTRVDFALQGWLNVLNRDPRLRVSAGLGTRVIQANQESYVARAWTQVKTILDANRRIRLARLNLSALLPLHNSFFAKLEAPTLIAVARPLAAKILGSPVTIHHQIQTSNIASAPLDSALRRILRERGTLARKLRRREPDFRQGKLVADVASGRVTAAPPKTLPPGLPSATAIAGAITAAVPHWLVWLKEQLVLLVLALLLLAAVALAAGLVWLAGILVLAAVAAAGLVYFNTGKLALGLSIADPAKAADIIEAIPARPDFRLVETSPPVFSGGTAAAGTNPSMPNGVEAQVLVRSTSLGAGRDNQEAALFRKAAIGISNRLAIRPAEEVRPTFDIPNASRKMLTAMEPKRAWPRLLASEVVWAFAPDWLQDSEKLVPAMAYPDFDDPMYEKLRDLSKEYFLPNLNLIKPETITLLTTNPPFIESYMVGLNHEFGRELLWREYPTDQRGSYFRQFWSTKGLVVPKSGLTDEQLKAMYRDIVPLDTWKSASELGTHRPPERPNHGNLVLTIRGGLLKRYPNTLVYAQKAHFNGANAPINPRINDVKSRDDMLREIRFPVFQASVDPDIKFFGFDLSASDAQGDANPTGETDDWGWFFVIQEVPGEPHFGLDLDFKPADPSHYTWNDLSWTQLPPGRFLEPGTVPQPSFTNHLPVPARQQWARSSADMADVLFQRPVMIAIHAREMLEKLDA